MRIQPIQTKVFPGLIKGAKSLPKEIMTAAALTSTAAIAANATKGNNVTVNYDDYCGSAELSCVPLLSF